jgi:ABC-type cobalamin/Fe3+-siderophores transport system ATPase subunit
MVTTWWRAVRVLSPNGSGGTTLLVAALRALSTQLRDLRTSLAQLIQRVVQLGVEHSD